MKYLLSTVVGVFLSEYLSYVAAAADWFVRVLGFELDFNNWLYYLSATIALVLYVAAWLFLRVPSDRVRRAAASAGATAGSASQLAGARCWPGTASSRSVSATARGATAAAT